MPALARFSLYETEILQCTKKTIACIALHRRLYFCPQLILLSVANVFCRCPTAFAFIDRSRSSLDGFQCILKRITRFAI
ncbi:hypothetical protein WS86_15175 [Burkholderia savannae]|nr:hypothetical protein WS86_15175 [Burkholderia savannae]